MKTRANFLLTIFVALIFTNIATEAFAQTPEKGSSNSLNAPQQNQNIDIKKANNQKNNKDIIKLVQSKNKKLINAERS